MKTKHSNCDTFRYQSCNQRKVNSASHPYSPSVHSSSVVNRDGLEPVGVFANAVGLLDRPGRASVVCVEADLIERNRFETLLQETLLQGGSIRL